jgi:hypothetical protein
MELCLDDRFYAPEVYSLCDLVYSRKEVILSQSVQIYSFTNFLHRLGITNRCSEQI